MELILAIVLLAIILIKVLGDRARKKEYEKSVAQIKSSYSEWESKHVDGGLESELMRRIENPSECEEIWREVSSALQEMEHWKYVQLCLTESQMDKLKGSLKARFEQLQSDRKIVLNILLAKRGKVSHDSAMCGYNAFLKYGTPVLKNMYYEYAEWIMKTLHSQGVDVVLRYDGCLSYDRYVWKGSFADRELWNDEVQGTEFSRKLLL